MTRYEYKVVPAPHKGTKAKGVKTPEGRFALSVEQILNQMGAEGWEYQRAELLPSDERSGLTGSTTHWRNVLVFRRLIEAKVPEQPVAEPVEAVVEETIEAAVDDPPPGTPIARPIPGPDESARVPAPISEPVNDPPMASGAERMLKDNGVEELSDVSGMTESLRSRAEQVGSETAETPDETESAPDDKNAKS